MAANDPNIKQEAPAKQVGSLTVSIPTRKVYMDRKGRKRRVAVKFSASLTGGPGSMSGKQAVNEFKRELGDRESTKIPLTQATMRQIIKVLTPKKN